MGRERERAAKRGTEPKGGNRKASKEGGDRCGDRLVRTRVARVFRLFCAREREKERKKEGRKKRNRLFCSRRRGKKKKNKCHNAVRSGSPAPTCKNKEDYEVRRGCSYDKCRGSCVVCKGVRAFHTGADLEVVDAL